MKILVYDNPNTSCSVLEHFEKNWQGNTKLHPATQNFTFLKFPKSSVDMLQIVDGEDKILLQLKDEKALRLDLLQEEIIKLFT